MIPRNRRIINLQAIEENMRMLRSVTPSTAKMMAVVKADGYGHGAAETAEAAIRGGADMLAVASVGEGKKLREKKIKQWEEDYIDYKALKQFIKKK